MVLSSIFFLDLKGKVLLHRDYRGDISPDAAEKFMGLLSDLEDQKRTATPILTCNDITYVHIRHANLYILALTKRNSNVMTILLFLHRLVDVFTEYFRELEEESLRDNFVVVYELLDEMMDFGHAQTTEKNILKEYITQQSFQLDTGPARPPSAVTSAVSWRSEGIKYRKNEVFLDVIESLNLLVNSNGNVVQSEIVGSVKVRCYLSGMPELRLGLNDRILFENSGRAGRAAKTVDLEDAKFHQCVRLQKFESERAISFIPPDGDFELMSYRMTPTAMKPPIWVECVIERWSASRIEYLIKAKSQLKKRTNANGVEIIIPVPEDADTPKFKVHPLFNADCLDDGWNGLV
jgi:AP-1 complex subunit mu